jgi:hypothetical protein
MEAYLQTVSRGKYRIAVVEVSIKMKQGKWSMQFRMTVILTEDKQAKLVAWKEGKGKLGLEEI